MSALSGLSWTSRAVYDVIVRRFLSIFYPAAVYQKVAITTKVKEESFFASFKVLAEPGYLKVVGVPGEKKGESGSAAGAEDRNVSGSVTSAETGDGFGDNNSGDNGDGNEDMASSQAFFEKIQSLKKGMTLPIQGMEIKEGKTSPPKRYNSGSLILAMENAGQLIEDEELRAQIKGSGIGTSATRGEILKKLFNNKYLALNKKTQIVTPTMLGEMIYDVVDHSVRSLLNPELTASWEKGLTYVADGDITSDEYMMKLDRFVSSRTEGVKGLNNQYQLRACYDRVAPFYKNEKQTTKYAKSGRAKSGTKTSAKSGSKSSGRKSTKTANRYNKKD